MSQMPIYMQNEEWWTTDENGWVVLTDKAPQEAIDAYNKDWEKGIILSVVS